MKKKQMQKIAYRFAGLALAFSMSFSSYAVEPGDLEDVQDRIDEQQEEIDRTNEEIQNTKDKQQKLEEAKANMEAYLQDLNRQYASIGEEIAELQAQIEAKQKEIEETEAQLAKARETEERQYDNMRIRIQQSYETPKTSFFERLLTGESFSEALNRADNAASVAQYDQDMLEAYVANKEAIEETEAKLQGEKEALDELYTSVVDKKNQVSALQNSTSGKINQHVNDIASAQAELNGQEDTLENQKEVLKELIAEKKRIEAAIEAAKKAEIENSLGDVTGVRTTEQEWVQYGAYGASEEEVTALAVLIHCEAANQGDDGRLAVGAVVMNRIRDPRFAQGDIMSVIRAPGQFSPVTSGRFDLILQQDLGSVSEACYTAARRAIAGESNVGNRVFFRTYANSPALSGLVIGAHIFSYTWNFAAP